MIIYYKVSPVVSKISFTCLVLHPAGEVSVTHKAKIDNYCPKDISEEDFDL